ncbi:MFS transporter [Fischerella sp. PCC 9605]|uniref:MFS transporter n=1 Tax=Fischerella sp. PCC 9605 TaxID=1173024 RepID=UPI0004AEFF1F|nr:MFS transporter [Fischerella sp. PCC 9605]
MNSESVPQNFSSSRRSPSQKWWALLSVGLGFTMFTLDNSIVNIALPSITNAFHTDLATAQWVIVSYLIVLTALMLSAARLGNMFGRQKLFQSGLILFTASSLLCGLAPGIVWLIGFRVLQGLGAVLIAGLGMAMITELFGTSPQYGLALSLAAMTLSLGSVFGASVGGFLVALGDWRAIFLINIPIGIIAIFLFTWCVPPSQVQRDTSQYFDGLGSILLVVVMVSFSFGMSEGQKQGFDSAIALILFAIAVISLIIFVWVESRIEQPIVDLSLFRNPILTINLLTMVVIYIAIAFRLFIYPFFLELALKYPIDQVGLLMITYPITNAIIAPISGRLVDKFGSRFLIPIGLMLLTFGCVLASTFTTQLTPLGYVFRDMVLGIGLAMWRTPNNTDIMSNAPPDKLGIVSGLLNESSMIGQTIGTPLASALFATFAFSSTHLARTTPPASLPPQAFVFAMHWTFLFVAILLGITVICNGLFHIAKRPPTKLSNMPFS